MRLFLWLVTMFCVYAVTVGLCIWMGVVVLGCVGFDLDFVLGLGLVILGYGC